MRDRKQKAVRCSIEAAELIGTKMTEMLNEIKVAMNAGAHGWFNDWRGRRCWRRLNDLIAEYSKRHSVPAQANGSRDHVCSIDQDRPHATSSGRKARLSPVVKAWLDRVLVPAMVERYIAKFRSGSDNQVLESAQ